MNSNIQSIGNPIGHLDNHALNRINLIISILAFGTGLVLFFKFHVGHGAFRGEWLGLGKSFWLSVHQVSGALFLMGLVLHILAHAKYINRVVRRWGSKSAKKLKKRTRWQILLLLIGTIVIWAGIYPWITLPEASLEDVAYHGWIDIHARVGLFFFVGLFVHIVKRWRRIFTVKGGVYMAKLVKKQARRKDNSSGGRGSVSQKKSTRFIIADTSKCVACWDCIDECKFGVLGKLNVWIHKHVIVKNRDACAGCGKCVAVCPHGVFIPVTQPRKKQKSMTAPSKMSL